MDILSTNDPMTAKMVEMFNMGYSLRQIGKALYFSSSAVGNRLREIGIDTNRRYGIRDDDPITVEIVNLYSNGVSVSKIADTIPLSEGGIRRRLISAGVKMRPKSRRPIPESTIKRILELHDTGMDRQRIAKICCVSPPTVSKYTKSKNQKG